ncbi:MAG: hydantoinase/oxoprolinase family protein [Candidatus Binatia bacterium]|nr:hydantoinase/oxoprolinase family protein [Candidatus Binatia bacterium]
MVRPRLSAKPPTPILVGIDTGGTFTDLVAVIDGELRLHKVPSTPADPAQAVLAGLRHLLGERAGCTVTYSSTVATNALLERRGARVALLTTAGFEDVIEIGRQNRPDLYDPEPKRPEPLVPRKNRISVQERMLHTGEPLVPLSERAIANALGKLAQSGAESVAICFLHSYANPVHERAMERAVRQRGFVFVSVSHALANEHREYERFSTAVTNAYVQPLMQRHLETLQQSLASRGARLRVLQSSGGAVSASLAGREAVRTCLSGPAGGVRGAWAVARSLGIRQAISFDMGGTSTDVSLLDSGVPTTTEWSIAGLPLKVPAVDVHTVGAGGGSIAAIDEGGLLKVGPQSAGADPGPACYGRGNLPTVTDANVVLGRVVPWLFLGGSIPLSQTRARSAVGALARRLGKSVEATAAGIIDVVNASMERAIRAVSIERGHDPRGCALIAFGGAAGQHACALADALGMSRVVIPLAPGLLSAWGALTAPVERTAVRSLLWREPSFAALEHAASLLVAQVRHELSAEGIPPARQRIETKLEVRYAGQSYELAVDLAPDYRARFERAHQQWYGYHDPERAVEVVNLRVFGRERPLPLRFVDRSVVLAGKTATKHRVFYRGRWHTVVLYERDALRSGELVVGPALIVELSSTTWIPPRWSARRHPTGHLLLQRAANAATRWS